MKRHTVLIVDDHPLVRRGIRTLLQSQPDLHIVGEAAEGMTALHLIQLHQPDLVVLDIVMPGVGGVDLLRELARTRSHTKLVVLSLHDDPAYVQEAMRLGASGYVLKHSASTALIPAVRSALSGRFYSSCTPAGEATALPTGLRPHTVTDRTSLLTHEERTVLRLFARGSRDEEVSANLSRTALPLPLLCRNIALKLGLTDTADIRAQASQWVRDNP
jgi:DNA-binding NarL/FixJ family response regulator